MILGFRGRSEVEQKDQLVGALKFVAFASEPFILGTIVDFFIDLDMGLSAPWPRSPGG